MALKRVCDITGTDRDVEICDVTIAGQTIKLDLSPAGADKLREFFGPTVAVQHPLATAAPDDAESSELAVQAAPEAGEPVVLEPQQVPATDAAAKTPARRARKLSSGKGRPKKAAAPRGSNPAAQGTSEIREWARANGFEIGDRGAIPGRIRSAYAVAHE